MASVYEKYNYKNHRQPPNFKYTDTVKQLTGAFRLSTCVGYPQAAPCYYSHQDGRHDRDTILILTFKHSTALG